MRKVKIISVILTLVLISNIGIIGCSNKNEDLNESIVSTKDKEKSDIEDKVNEKLTVVSKDEYKIEDKISDSPIQCYFNSDGNLIVEGDIIADWGEADSYYEFKLEKGRAKLLKYNEIKRNHKYSSCNFFVDEIDDSKVKVYNKIGDEGFIIDRSLIEQGNLFYYDLRDNLLVATRIFEPDWRYRDEVRWDNLSDGTKGSFKFNDKAYMLENEKYKDKLYLLYTPSEMPGSSADTIMVIDLKTSKVESDYKVGDKGYITPLDDKRILMETNSFLHQEGSLSIYNIENKGTKDILSWEHPKLLSIQSTLSIKTIMVSPSGNKLLYLETKKEGGYDIKVVEINGSEIGEPITVFTMNLYEGGSYIVQPSFSPNGESLIIFDNSVNKSITKIQFNK